MFVLFVVLCLYLPITFTASLPETVSLSWRKGWLAEDNVLPTNGGGLVALSAFLLTTLPNSLARKNLVQEIWNSGANTIVRIFQKPRSKVLVQSSTKSRS